MLSLMPREGACGWHRAGARALALFLALAASLSAAAAPPIPSRPPPSATAAAATADPDAALQRLAGETDQLNPSAPDAVARLKAVVRELIAIDRAQCRAVAALRAGSSLRGGLISRRRSRKKSAPSPPAPPAAGEATQTAGALATGAAPPAAGMLFAKRGLKKVHRPGCVFGERIKPEDRVYFKSLKDAEAAGYEPCKICRPN